MEKRRVLMEEMKAKEDAEKVKQINYRREREESGGRPRVVADSLPALRYKGVKSSFGGRGEVEEDNNGKPVRRPALARRTVGGGMNKDSSLPNINDRRKLTMTRDPDEGLLKPCPLGCGRKFGPEVLDKHMEICQKVFTGMRDQYDSAKYRMNTKKFRK